MVMVSLLIPMVLPILAISSIMSSMVLANSGNLAGRIITLVNSRETLCMVLGN